MKRIFILALIIGFQNLAHADGRAGHGQASAYIDSNTSSVIHLDITGDAAKTIYDGLATAEEKDAERLIWYKDLPGGFFCSKSAMHNSVAQYSCLLKVSRK